MQFECLLSTRNSCVHDDIPSFKATGSAFFISKAYILEIHCL